MPAILAFLLLWGCIPTANIRINDAAVYPGYYHVEGWIEIRSNTPDYVLVHELAHSCGADEKQAHRLETIWRDLN